MQNDKPGSVKVQALYAHHLSGPVFTNRLEQPTR